MKRSKNIISIWILLAALTLSGCSASDAVQQKNGEEQQTQSRDESKGIESPQPESTPEQLYYTMFGSDCDWSFYRGCGRKKQRAYECF